MEIPQPIETEEAHGTIIDARRSHATPVVAMCAAIAGIAGGCSRCGCDDDTKKPSTESREPDLAQVRTYNYGQSPSQERETTDGGLGVVRSIDYGDRPPETEYPKSCKTDDGRLVPEGLDVGTATVTFYDSYADGSLGVGEFYHGLPHTALGRFPDEINSVPPGRSMEAMVICGRETWLEIEYPGDRPNSGVIRHEGTHVGIKTSVDVDSQELDKNLDPISGSEGTQHWMRFDGTPAKRWLSLQPRYNQNHQNRGSQRGR